METTIISLGGSIIIPDKIDVDFLKKLKELVLEHVRAGNRMILVCGGGSICRTYQNAVAELVDANNVDKDWIGIMATRLNAELVRVMFKGYAHATVVYNPHEAVDTDKKIIIAAGYEPGFSTDMDAVILAKQFKADLIVNTTNVDYVYDKDPNKFDDAKELKNLSWAEFKRLVGDEFKSGMHAPFDPIASKTAMEKELKVAIVNGRNLDNLKKLLKGEEFIGTVIGE